MQTDITSYELELIYIVDWHTDIGPQWLSRDFLNRYASTVASLVQRGVLEPSGSSICPFKVSDGGKLLMRFYGEP